MLKLQDVSKSFFGTCAVDGVSFEVKKGEIVGFLGPNGAGKTTTLRMIATLLEPDAGTIEFKGKNVWEWGASFRRHLGFMPENNPLYDDMRTGEYLEYISRLKGLWGSEQKRAIDEAVEETDLASVFWRPVGELSKGFKQRVGLAQAIMHAPELLLLDEPNEGIDPVERIEIRNLIKRLGKDRSVIVSTHVLQEVAAMCTRALIIKKGKIVADGTVDELLSQTARQRVVHVEGEGLKDATVLGAIPGVLNVIEQGPKNTRRVVALLVAVDKDPRPLIFDHAKENGWRIWDLHEERANLEDVFRELTVEERV